MIRRIVGLSQGRGATANKSCDSTGFGGIIGGVARNQVGANGPELSLLRSDASLNNLGVEVRYFRYYPSGSGA